MGKIKQIETADVLNCIYEGTPVYMLIRCNEETTFAEAIDADAFVVIEEEQNIEISALRQENACITRERAGESSEGTSGTEKSLKRTTIEHAEKVSDDFYVMASKEELENALPPDVPDKYPAKKKSKQEKVDHGRIIALRRGGWSVAKIADDIGCTEQTVYNHLNREGLK